MCIFQVLGSLPALRVKLYFIFPLLYISVVLEPRITLEYIACSYV